MNYDSVILNLQHSIQEEHKAAAVYRLRAKSADPVTKKLYLATLPPKRWSCSAI